MMLTCLLSLDKMALTALVTFSMMTSLSLLSWACCWLVPSAESVAAWPAVEAAAAAATLAVVFLFHERISSLRIARRID